MAEAGTVLVIGPLQQAAGGVATHIRNLQQLQAFAGATFYDPGSIRSQQRQSVYAILRKLLQLRRLVRRERFSKILINASIFPSSFIKLLLILGILPRTAASEIHVFFHGGRFAHSRLYTDRRCAGYFRRLLERVNCCHFLSPLQKQQFEQRFPGLTTAIYFNYSPADTTVSKIFGNAKTLRLLFVGRVTAVKGVFELIAAVEQLRRDPATSVHLRIVGDGDDLAALKQRAAALVNDGSVEISGYLHSTALEQAYRRADLLLLPTYHPEGFPYVVIEAFRFGVPVIATPEGALATLVQDGITGYQIAPRNPADIVDVIQQIVSGRGRLREMSDNCHAIFRDQLSRTAAERYYSQLLT